MANNRARLPMPAVRASLENDEQQVAAMAFSTHERIDARNLAMALVIADKVEADPTLLSQVKETLERWIAAEASPPPRCFQEWFSVLEQPLDEILRVLRSTSQQATRMRTSSPFSCLITQAERAELFESYSARAYYQSGQRHL